MSEERAKIKALVAALDAVDVGALLASGNGSDSNSDARNELLAASRRLTARLEDPFERLWHLSWIGPVTHAVLQVVMDLGLWEAWRTHATRGKTTTEDDHDDDVSLEELMDLCRTRCDMMLLRRLFRLLAAVNVVEETGPDRYRATPLSLALGETSGPVAQTLLSGTHHGQSARNLPEFLKRTNYEEPLDPANTNYMDLTPERLGLFARCQAEPALQASFIGFMAGLASYKIAWTEIYDPARLLVDDDDDKGVLFVDVGGAHGVDTTRLLDRYPDLPPGKLVLQDKPDVVAMARVSEKITTMGYDFFTPQPVEGARAYFMHAVLHDWDDRDARRILGRVAAAMRRGYSKLLIHEPLLPDVGATLYQSVADVSLMHLISASERTENRWRWLLQSAGFTVVKIWSHPGSVESVIEADLADEQ
ncbi:putative O-methyltransferase [Xylariomycetidae sp. FL2044]|nr:putative O-methyltransferase [Xylariomycetidae sp. FL2044]